MVGIGMRIRQCRLSCGMTQEDVARYLGITKQTVYKYETGIITNISIDQVDKMGKLFHVPPEFLVGWTDRERAFDPLQPEENRLLRIFRGLPDKGKEFLLQQARATEIMYNYDIEEFLPAYRVKFAEGNDGCDPFRSRE